MKTLRQIKRVAIGVIGGTVVALGIVLIVLPGPAFIVIPAGLAILAVEFAWARRWLNKVREYLPKKRTPQPADSAVGSGQPPLPIKKS